MARESRSKKSSKTTKPSKPKGSSWKVVFRKRAQRDFRAIDADTRQRILDGLQVLALDPYSAPNVKRMKGQDGFRFRVGNYRVLFSLIDDELVVDVIRVGNRRDIYR